MRIPASLSEDFDLVDVGSIFLTLFHLQNGSAQLLFQPDSLIYIFKKLEHKRSSVSMSSLYQIYIHQIHIHQIPSDFTLLICLTTDKSFAACRLKRACLLIRPNELRHLCPRALQKGEAGQGCQQACKILCSSTPSKRCNPR